MTSQLEYGSISNAEQAKRLGEILCQSFNEPVSDWLFYSEKIGQDNFRIIRKADEVVGGLAILQMNQWYGGKPIPMAGIASVAVTPEHRGTGVAAELLTNTLQELYSNGIPLSTLYAATQRPYRKVGYEQAGTCCKWEIQLDSMELRVSEVSLNEVRRLPLHSVPHKPELFKKIHQQWAIKNNGNLERNQVMWELLFLPQQGECYAYLLGAETQPEGYIIFNQTSPDCHLNIRDWVALTPTAAKRLWTFIADHRSMINKVIWRGSGLDPMLLLLSEQTARVSNPERWLLRVINVPKALEMRGYLAGMEAELHLKVRDSLLLENNGDFVLKVSGGRGEVSKGGKGDLQLDVQTLAPLYTGLFTPHQLQLIGKLEASTTTLAVAAQLFSASQPWMPDKF
ncbi:MAG: GNAT family N-acetyltransferase [Potamolinea sp.]